MQIPYADLTYKIVLGDKTFLVGSFLDTAVIFLFLLLLLLVILIYLWKRLHEDNRLKYEFITIVAHKFRTPLTYVKWICDELVTNETDQFKKKNLEDIKASNQKIIDLTSTLIEIADTESTGSATYVYKKLLLGDSVKNVANGLKDSFHNKNIFFGFHCDNDKILVRVDQLKLEFVIATLLENARNYTPPGRNVDVTVYAKMFKTYVVIEDTGIGISEQDMPHIFTKFFRGKNARVNDTDGFGVGLYLASSITKRLGGKIYAESAGEGRGSRFTVVLPRIR